MVENKDESDDSSSRVLLGDFEQAVLLGVYRLGKDAYTITLKQLLTDKETGRSPNLGSLHTTLVRLEKKGYLRSESAEPEPARRGRPKKVYFLTGAGADALNSARRRFEQRWLNIDGVVLNA